jgi:hypothetical protein
MTGVGVRAQTSGPADARNVRHPEGVPENRSLDRREVQAVPGTGNALQAICGGKKRLPSPFLETFAALDACLFNLLPWSDPITPRPLGVAPALPERRNMVRMSGRPTARKQGPFVRRIAKVCGDSRYNGSTRAW